MRSARRAALALVIFWGVGFRVRAQELLVNGGFEQYTRCPTGPGLIDGWLDSWHRTNVASSDFHHDCGFTGAPNRSGLGHAGLLLYDPSGNYREYLTGVINPPLVAGRTYRIDMHVILSSGYLNAVAELGAFFSTTQPTWPGIGPPPGIVPQVENASGPLEDKIDWMLVSGTFVASGGESYVTIGNFHDDASTTITGWSCCGQFGAYYHFDDLSIVEEGQVSPPCLHRSDASSVRPLTPPPTVLFMPETAGGLSLQGLPSQCPIADGDLESDPNALSNGVPLSFYQVDRLVTLLLSKSGSTIRFGF